MNNLLPHDAESERAVAGAILLLGVEGLERALRTGLDFPDFYSEPCRLVVRAAMHLASKGKPIDALTVKSALAESGNLEAVGAPFLLSLTDGIPTALNVEAYAERVHAKGIERRAIAAAENFRTAMLSGNGQITPARADLEAALFNLRNVGGKVLHSFEQAADERYALVIPEARITIEVDRLRRESNELIGELCVRCDLPGVPTYDGALSIADFNLSSARARTERAKLLSSRANSKDLDWAGYLEEFCQRVLVAERNGQPAVDLRELERPGPDDSISIEGLRLPRRHATILFGDGGAAKSYTGLYLAGRLAQQGLSVALFDWELAGEDHRDRLERLFGQSMPKILYAKCERALVHEVDRLTRIVRNDRIDYAIYDSIAFACDGAPEAAEIAGKYFRAVRQIGVGSLQIAHITKAEGGDQKPFGSVFWHNGARSTYFVKVGDTSPDGKILTIGIFNRKTNLGPLVQPIGFRIEFGENRTSFTKADPSDTPDLAERMSVRQRMMGLLRAGSMSLEDLADTLDAKADTISRTVRRYKNQFTIIDGGKVALLQRDS